MAIFTSADLSRTELRRRAKSGELQPIASGIYSDDTNRTPEQVVAREWRAILGAAMPGAVISYANAFTGLPADGELNVSHTRRHPLVLPGLTIRPDMAGRREADDIPLGNGVFLASPARALIDNSADHPGRPNTRVVKLDREQLHDQIVRIAQTTSPSRLDSLVREVRSRAPRTVGEGIDMFFKAARAEIGTVDTPSRAMRAAQTGEGYDSARVGLFRDFAQDLAGMPPAGRPVTLPQLARQVPFFEAYFSNFIEGTEFTVEEAEAIVFDDADLDRPEDAHDVRGTYLVTAAPEMRHHVRDASDFLDSLRSRHATMMAAHPTKGPGRWKDRANRAGATEFVAPELVQGTLRAGWEEGARIENPFHRAVYVMFLVSEVHPFLDGNGRSARVAMNNELVADNQHRIIVPTILRLDYLSALTRATNRGGPQALFRVLDFAQNWVSAGDWSGVGTGLDYCHATHALIDARQAEEQRLHLTIPRWSAMTGPTNPGVQSRDVLGRFGPLILGDPGNEVL